VKNTEYGIEPIINHIMYKFDINGDPENICVNYEKEMPKPSEWQNISPEDIEKLMTTNCEKCKKLLTYKVLRNE